MATTTLGSGLIVGRRVGGTMSLTGAVAREFVTDYAMAGDEVAALFAKGSALGPSVPNLDDQAGLQIVQGLDDTNLYVIGDIRKRISGRVNTDGSIAEAVGGDFRVVKSATGQYDVYLPPGFFSSPPVVTADSGGTAVTAYVNTSTATWVRLVALSAAGAATDPVGIYFVAEGRGPIPSTHQIDLSVAA